MMSVIIRPYSPADREAIRTICCDTGFSGNPVDPLFTDREVFADFFTRYYTDWEPESSFVVEDDEKVVGYLTGCYRYRYHAWVGKWILFCVVLKVLWRLCTGNYPKQSRAFLKWCLFQGSRQTPKAPKRAAHFHFNLLLDYRAAGIGVKLCNTFIDYLKKKGMKKVYGQIQTFDDRRTLRAFGRYGFVEYDRKEITKFRSFHDQKVYVSTMIKEF